MAATLAPVAYRPLSSAIEELHGHYDAVVIGSGYGGAIAACRLAQARRKDGSRLRIALLERGREIGPGQYPKTLFEFNALAQYTLADTRIGPEDGLFDFRAGGDVAVVQGCGLGGTSLINANLAAEPVQWVLQDSAWPKGFHKDLPRWPAFVARAKAMLEPEPFPADRPQPGKLRALQKSAEKLGKTCISWPVNVSFEAHTNAAGMAMNACDGCGDCVTGCNRGAKNTVLFNYLPMARRHGAQLFCQLQVQRLERQNDRWQVLYRPIGAGREALTDDLPFITADLVVLGAGALGSAEILERSRRAGLKLSPRLGKQFSGNGDVLGFGFNCDDPVGALGTGDTVPEPKDAPGPCISGVIDLRESENPKEHGMFIMDGVLPAAFLPVMPVTLAAAAGVLGKDTDSGLVDELKELGRAAAMLIPGVKGDALENTQTYLVMCHDAGQGQLQYDDHGRASVIWPGAGDASYLQNCDERLQQCTAALGGTHVPNPTWNPLLDRKLISCHPMGTCAMGESAEQGVVDHKGRVFAGETGVNVHPGLYVTDAAVIPRSVGVNPLLTISTLAERALDHLLRDHQWTLDAHLPPLPQLPPSKVGMRFTEKMSGRLGLGETKKFPEQLWAPHTVGSDASFVVTVHSDDLDEVLDQPSHRARLTGTFHVPGLHPDPMAVQSGEFHLFVDDPLRPGAKTMNYDFEALDEAGKTWTLQGEKRIEDDAGLDLWNDTTQLFTTVYEGAGTNGKVAAMGLLKVHLGDLLVALKSIEVLGTDSKTEEFDALVRCGKYFVGTLAKSYF